MSDVDKKQVIEQLLTLLNSIITSLDPAKSLQQLKSFMEATRSNWRTVSDIDYEQWKLRTMLQNVIEIADKVISCKATWAEMATKIGVQYNPETLLLTPASEERIRIQTQADAAGDRLAALIICTLLTVPTPASLIDNNHEKRAFVDALLLGEDLSPVWQELLSEAKSLLTTLSSVSEATLTRGFDISPTFVPNFNWERVRNLLYAFQKNLDKASHPVRQQRAPLFPLDKEAAKRFIGTSDTHATKELSGASVKAPSPQPTTISVPVAQQVPAITVIKSYVDADATKGNWSPKAPTPTGPGTPRTPDVAARSSFFHQSSAILPPKSASPAPDVEQAKKSPSPQ